SFCLLVHASSYFLSLFYLLLPLSSLCVWLFFCVSAALRDLHSFPTRRSSDLGGIGRFSPSSTEGRVLLATTDSGWDRLLPSRFRDRKSTRLNSSHVSSSYAVFCLKKKKIDQILMSFPDS